MNFLQYIHEPERLLLTWQCSEDQRPRTRRVVAEVVRSNDEYIFNYLIDTEDYNFAIKQGFKGYAAFSLEKPVHNVGVMDALARRLPPRKREDFSNYLMQFRLPSSFSGSDFSLLGYTGGKLPSDTFSFVPDFSSISQPIDLLLEVAGFRHQSDLEQLTPQVGDNVAFEVDCANTVDINAVQIVSKQGRLGYVNRAFLPWFTSLVCDGRVIFGEIERINGKPERPLIYIFCRIE
ncbi:hypothetical protein [Deefgea rivuli]|uniref:hypothetical protein n=1 Tax=Deefgea rivuli TaxID=400948 RepID=UPI0006886913|nr:hypothetical protein [Deefgea rivuli]